MSAVTVARVEIKIQSLILGPLWLCFIAGALISAYFGAWWVAATYAFLCFYIGWIGKSLGIHSGKSFRQLSQGVKVPIPGAEMNEVADISPEESLRLGLTVHHILYAITVAAGTLSLVAGMGYWTILICLAVFMLGRGLSFGVVVLMHRSLNR